MSIETNTYEELHICNVNEKTAAICGLVGEYLVPTGYRSFLQIAPVVAEYKKLTGVDLTEYGVANLFVN